MRAVLISIRPQFCEMIAAWEKTLEIRKTKPAIETPFKCYIYQTKKKWLYKLLVRMNLPYIAELLTQGRGKVIGEFVCDFVYPITDGSDWISNWLICKMSCLTEEEIRAYGGKFAWSISNLKIYKKPKSLSQFHFPPETFCEKGLCGGCPEYGMPDEYGDVMFDCEWKRPVLKAPQSWCYVEEV